MAKYLHNKRVGSWNHLKIDIKIENDSSYTNQIVQIWTAQLDQTVYTKENKYIMAGISNKGPSVNRTMSYLCPTIKKKKQSLYSGQNC